MSATSQADHADRPLAAPAPTATAPCGRQIGPDAGPSPGTPTRSGTGSASGRRRPARRAHRHDVDRLARAVALLWLEVESGRRTPATVAHLLDHGLWQRLRHRWVRGGPPGRLVRLLVHRKSATLCDAVAVVARGDRTGAITFRLCQRDDGWCVVEAGLPELDGAR